MVSPSFYVTTRAAQTIPASAFKEGARPLHVTVTYTPPTTPDNDGVAVVPADSDLLGGLVAQPSTFTTGSYGWKGNKRLTVELVDPSSGEKTNVQVMLTVNAVVLGSKQAGKEAEGEAEIEAKDNAAEEDGPVDAEQATE
ncbi:hypothetical protein BGW80DRAFT_1167219 [Lactifluus volemus]|nr:hypothetical protein BGW80DRAFT_1167219 [Lactifluus volemus]